MDKNAIIGARTASELSEDMVKYVCASTTSDNIPIESAITIYLNRNDFNGLRKLIDKNKNGLFFLKTHYEKYLDNAFKQKNIPFIKYFLIESGLDNLTNNFNDYFHHPSTKNLIILYDEFYKKYNELTYNRFKIWVQML